MRNPFRNFNSSPEIIRLMVSAVCERSNMTKEIFIAIISSVIGAVASGLVTWALVTNQPPSAQITPTEVTVKANELVSFSAQGSSDPDGDKFTYDWTVAGAEPSKAFVAFCPNDDVKETLKCRFITPGVHIVAVTTTDEKGNKNTAPTSVKVEIQGGYVGVVLQHSSPDPRVMKAVQYAVDWPSVQAMLVGRVIILMDPESRNVIYASHVKQSLDKAKEFVAQAGGITGLKLLAPNLPRNVQEKLLLDLSRAGIQVTFVRMPVGEIFKALQSGQSDSGLVVLSSPDELQRIYRNLNSR